MVSISGTTKRDPTVKVALSGSSVITSIEEYFHSFHSTNDASVRAHSRSAESGIAMQCGSAVRSPSESTKYATTSNICWEGLTKNGTRTPSSGPRWIGTPRLSRMRNDPLHSLSPSGNASVRNGLADFLSVERSKKESEGLAFFAGRPVRIVFSFRNMKARFPCWESTCKVGMNTKKGRAGWRSSPYPY